MKNKKTLVIIILVFVLILAGATVLYNQLGKDLAPDQLSVQSPQGAAVSETKEPDEKEDGSESQDTEKETERNEVSTEEQEASTEEKASETEESEMKKAEESTETGQTKGEKDSAQEQETEAETERKISAPDFTVYTREGEEVKLSDHFGKPIVLNFWASWCGPCQMEMPDFNEKYLEMADEVNFLMINMTDGSRETVDGASEFIEEKGYEFPVFYDTDMDAASTYGAYSLPTTYFIDQDGYVIAQAKGAIDGETLQRGLDLIME